MILMSSPMDNDEDVGDDDASLSVSRISVGDKLLSSDPSKHPL